MAKVRTPGKNSKYYISKQKFLTARHYCLQYPEWLDEYKMLSGSGIEGISYDGSLRGPSNPTEFKAIRMAELSRKIELVRQIAAQAGGDIAEWVLKGVTSEDATFGYLKTVMGIPCEKDMYYDRRRKFYWLISQKI